MEIDRLNTELEEVGLLLNSRGELSKVLANIIELEKEVKSIKSTLSNNWLIKLFTRRK